MKLTGRSILIISPEPWDHIFVSKHHYAISLAQRGNHVYFLNPPQKSGTVQTTAFKNVLSVTYGGFPKGLRYYPRLLRRYFTRRRFDELQRICDTRFEIVWSFDNSVFFDFSALPQGILTISHMVDLNQDFQFAAAAKTADVCLGVSRAIVKKQRNYCSQSHFINHGYAQSVSPNRVQLPAKDVALRVGYAGNLDLKYIDWKILQHLIPGHTDIGFYFAGPFTTSASYAKWLNGQSNAFLLGRIPSAQIVTFYAQMDILILCYRSAEYPDQLTNSHKMMEYLGSGKMIVATFTAEYKELEDRNLLLMSNGNAQFPDKFRQALQGLEFWNDPEKQQLRKEWALENTYDKQLDRIERILNNVD